VKSKHKAAGYEVSQIGTEWVGVDFPCVASNNESRDGPKETNGRTDDIFVTYYYTIFFL
jgi:hypothetical protein